MALIITSVGRNCEMKFTRTLSRHLEVGKSKRRERDKVTKYEFAPVKQVPMTSNFTSGTGLLLI